MKKKDQDGKAEKSKEASYIGSNAGHIENGSVSPGTPGICPRLLLYAKSTTTPCTVWGSLS